MTFCILISVRDVSLKKRYLGTYKRINIKGEKYDILHSHQCERRVPQKKIFGYFLGHLSFWVSGMELPLFFFLYKKLEKLNIYKYMT